MDFFERNFSAHDNLQPIAPSECSVSLDLDSNEDVLIMSYVGVIHSHKAKKNSRTIKIEGGRYDNSIFS